MRHRVKVSQPMTNGQEMLAVITQGRHAGTSLDLGRLCPETLAVPHVTAQFQAGL